LSRYSARRSSSRRANSLSGAYRDPDGALDLEWVLDEASRFYAQRGACLLIQQFDAGPVPDFAQKLSAAGFIMVEQTLTLVKDLADRDAEPPSAAVADPLSTETAPADWLEVYLGAISPDRREVNARIIASMAAERAFFGAWREGRLASTALCVRKGELGIVECVATDARARRQGAAAETLGTLEHWARDQDITHLALQVIAANDGAQALYGRLGYELRDLNRFFAR